MAYKVTVAPAEEPLTLAEAKLWLRETGTAQNDVVTALITAERQLLEQALNVKLVSQTIEQKIDAFPYGDEVIFLDVGPVISVTSVQYKTGGTTATFSSDNYEVDTTSERPRIYLKEGSNWPVTEVEQQSGTITYLAGYASAAAVPEKYKKLLRHLIAFSYDNRMAPVSEKMTYIDKLINQERVWYFE